jgi:5-methylcytosine-specific restriction endonuclease McrA
MKNAHAYNPLWRDLIRPRIMLRDKFSCQHCGIKHKTVFSIDANEKVYVLDAFEKSHFDRLGYKYRVVHLQVCHIDQNPANDADDNLITLCPSCHFKMDNKFNLAKRLSK